MAHEPILIVDDDPMVVTLCARVLEEEGFETKGALNGKEGIEFLKEENFALILLDIKLPDRSGLDVLSTIREIDPEMAVVIITGHGTMEVAIRALKLGAQDFLLKPFTPEELVISVQRVLEKERLVQENLRLRARLPILEISKALMSEVNLERLTQLALETVQQELKVERVSLMLLDEERQELSISDARGLSDEVMATTRVKVGQGLASLAAQRRKPILLPEQAEEDPAIQALLTRSDTGPAICLPLMLKDRVLGVLNASRQVGGAPFRQDDVDLLSILGGQIAVAIENARLFEQAQEELAERKRAEEALRIKDNAIASSITAIAIAEFAGNLTYVNPSFLKMWGYDDENEVLGKPAVEFWQTKEKAWEVIEALRDGDSFAGELVAKRKDGSLFDAQLSASTVTDETGKPICMMASFVDITERKQAEEALRRHAEQLEALRRIGLELAAQLDLDALLHSISSRAIELLGGSSGGLYLYQPEQDVLGWAVSIGPNLAPIGSVLHRGEGLSGKVWETGEPLIVDAYQQWEGRAAVYEKYPWTAVVGVPVRWGETFLGVLDVLADAPRTFSSQDVELLSLFAAQAAVAIVNARLYEQQRQRVAQTMALGQTTLDITSQLDMPPLLHSIIERAAKLLNATGGVIHLYDPVEKKLEMVASRGLAVNYTGIKLMLGERVAGKVVESGEPLIVNDYRNWTGKASQLTDTPTRAIIGVPMKWQNRVIGVLDIIDQSGDKVFGEEDTWLLSQFADHAAIAIENARLYEATNQQHEQLRALAARLAEVEETERQRLARELHDQVGQNLTALGINLNIVQSQMPEGAADLVSSRLDDSLALVEQTTERIRNVMAELRPPVLDDYGLVAALHWYGEQYASRTGIAVTVEGEEPDPRLAAPVENALFRIGQEALTNVTRHAQATQVTVTAEVDGETVRLVVADDGIGFDPARLAEPDGRRGWGLLTMAERAEAVGGHCRIESRPQQGTQVIVEVPR